jgi:hypothetical protein
MYVPTVLSYLLFSTYLNLLPDSLFLLNIFFLAFSLVNFFYPIFFDPQSTFFLLHILALLPYIFLFLFLTCASRIFSFRLLLDFLREMNPPSRFSPPTRPPRSLRRRRGRLDDDHRGSVWRHEKAGLFTYLHSNSQSAALCKYLTGTSALSS